MPFAVVTTETTEQQFEAQIRAAILKAFFWLPASEIKHQLTFSFKFGHATITVNGKAKTKASARLDMLITHKGQPLAVLELKRPGTGVTPDDAEQALSYARVLHPRPPLAVVTDGEKTLVYATHSGELWEPASPTAAALKTLMTQAAAVAKVDIKRAVEWLMGEEPAVWMSAVRQTSDASIQEMTGGWDDPAATFVEGFDLPRRATGEAYKRLDEGRRLLNIEGGPQSGKSHVLRQLVEVTRDDPDLAVLYVDADPGVDLFETIAGILSSALAWPLARDEARAWLMARARAQGPALVIAVDNFGVDRDDLRRDIETLTSNAFGAGVRVVLAVDDALASGLMRQRTGRGASTLSRRATRLAVGPLDNEEFKRAERSLHEHRISIMRGGRHSTELRMPWVLRAMASEAARDPNYQREDLSAVFSSVPGLDIISWVRERIDVSEAPFSLYRELAKAILRDVEARPSVGFMVEMQGNFIVRRQTALALLGATELKALIDAGLVREGRSGSDENIYIIRLPQVMASEIATLVAAELPSRNQESPAAAAHWLCGLTGAVPLGNAIAAQALIDAAVRQNGLTVNLTAELMKRAPKKEVLADGTRVAAWMDGVGAYNMVLEAGGVVAFEYKGQKLIVEPEDDESKEHVVYGDFHPWLLLSLLAAHPFEIVGPDKISRGRGDMDLLLQIGACPIVLRSPGGDPDVTSVAIHEFGPELSVVCHRAGIVEPITWAIFRFLGREAERAADAFVEQALAEASPALLARMDIALRQLSESADQTRNAWARRTREKRLNPMLAQELSAFAHL